jgi:M6 family metalloprotease-like protein
MPKMAKYLIIALLLVLCAGGHSLVPAHPMYQEIPDAWQATRIEALRNFTPNRNSSFENSDLSSVALQQANPTKNNEKTSALPHNILALMVQFSDVSFKAMPQAPDYLVHDRVFFERWMLHLQDFYTDASHGRYLMNYTVHPQVLTLPHSMSFYGNDTSEKIDKLLPQILTDLMPLCDQQIDFSQYQGLIIFHAGTGQESDIDGIRTNQIWSTFLTRKLLQSYYDPDNDSYPGFTTGDGAILTNVVIVSEDEFQDYFPPPESEDHDSYLFSIFGVLAHQFGHVLGLPTLFDNDSSNGKSQG